MEGFRLIWSSSLIKIYILIKNHNHCSSSLHPSLCSHSPFPRNKDLRGSWYVWRPDTGRPRVHQGDRPVQDPHREGDRSRYTHTHRPAHTLIHVCLPSWAEEDHLMLVGITIPLNVLEEIIYFQSTQLPWTPSSPLYMLKRTPISISWSLTVIFSSRAVGILKP